MPHVKRIEHKLFELRIRGRQEFRMFFTMHAEIAFMLHGYIKKAQQIPARELFLARNRLMTIERIYRI
jgi:phage-related protein